jgi:transcriptional regulator with XRE-family HTH domain
LHYPSLKDTKTIIGRVIKQQRIQRGLTLDELAEKLDTERQYVWKLENGKVNISANYLDKVIKELKSKHEDFLNTSINP